MEPFAFGVVGVDFECATGVFYCFFFVSCVVEDDSVVDMGYGVVGIEFEAFCNGPDGTHQEDQW